MSFRPQISYCNKGILNCECTLALFFPCASPQLPIPVLCTGCTFSLALLVCFPALGTNCTFSLPTVACFPALGTGCMFFPRLAPLARFSTHGTDCTFSCAYFDWFIARFISLFRLNFQPFEGVRSLREWSARRNTGAQNGWKSSLAFVMISQI